MLKCLKNWFYGEEVDKSIEMLQEDYDYQNEKKLVAVKFIFMMILLVLGSVIYAGLSKTAAKMFELANTPLTEELNATTNAFVQNAPAYSSFLGQLVFYGGLFTFIALMIALFTIRDSEQEQRKIIKKIHDLEVKNTDQENKKV